MFEPCWVRVVGKVGVGGLFHTFLLTALSQMNFLNYIQKGCVCVMVFIEMQTLLSAFKVKIFHFVFSLPKCISLG